MNGMIDEAMPTSRPLTTISRRQRAEAHGLAVVADDGDPERLLAPGLAVVLTLARHQQRRVQSATIR